MTDIRHIIDNPNRAAADAEIMKAIVHLEAAREFLRMADCEAPRVHQSTATDMDWQPIGSVASRVVDKLVKREAAE